MSYYARRAICSISDICMPYILVSLDLDSVQETPLPRPRFRMQLFAANVLYPYESNDTERVESPCTAALSSACAYTS